MRAVDKGVSMIVLGGIAPIALMLLGWWAPGSWRYPVYGWQEPVSSPGSHWTRRSHCSGRFRRYSVGMLCDCVASADLRLLVRCSMVGLSFEPAIGLLQWYAHQV